METLEHRLAALVGDGRVEAHVAPVSLAPDPRHRVPRLQGVADGHGLEEARALLPEDEAIEPMRDGARAQYRQ